MTEDKGRDILLSTRLRRGRELEKERKREREKDVLGNLRAGNSGIMSEGGDVAGHCHRRTHLRHLGIEVEDHEDHKMIMFQMGTANEGVIYNDLLYTSGDDEVILREEEIPISWLTRNGTKVTGRPDMVICERHAVAISPEGDTLEPDTSTGLVIYKGSEPPTLTHKITPRLGIEIKGVASVWTSREVLFEGKPKVDHLIQAAHYSWQLNVPFRLLYKNYVNQAIPSWAQKMFPKQGQPLSEHIEYNTNGDVKNINPFELVYEIGYSKAGYLRYRVEGTEAWKYTPIRTEDIERYYNFVAEMSETKDLGPMPLTIDAEGKEKNWSVCDYCPLAEICRDKKASSSYDVWLQNVKRKLGIHDEGEAIA